jgi:hypothetical protein
MKGRSTHESWGHRFPERVSRRGWEMGREEEEGVDAGE